MQFKQRVKTRRAFRRKQAAVAAYLVVTSANVMITDVFAQQADDNTIIRLESTIRGDQQQPRVLSIVPWDSPPHMRMGRVALTGDVMQPMAPIERQAFLNRLALHQTLFGPVQPSKPDSESEIDK